MLYRETLETLCIATLIVHCFICIGASEVVQTETNAGGKKLLDFKNKEILLQNEIPELALVKTIIDTKYENLKGLVDAWDAIDHDNLRLSAGESFLCFFIKNFSKQYARTFEMIQFVGLL